MLLTTGLLAITAHATLVYTGDMVVTASDPTQQGRLLRGGTGQDWSGGELFPGVNNAGATFHYSTLTLDFDTLIAGLGVDYGGFVQINFDSESADTFLSAYLDSYNPANKAQNWLGDEGSSGNIFGNPQFFQVIVPFGHDLVLLLNETALGGFGLDVPGTVLVEAFSDTEYTDLAPRRELPEPDALALLLAAVAAAAVAARRRTALTRRTAVAA
ncbi:MAG: hypothetical protein EON87_17590 [Brevundimonas sp.]|nr:MAG: hypothetical protein EON87_17590 [Brevundimonas sp.]